MRKNISTILSIFAFVVSCSYTFAHTPPQQSLDTVVLQLKWKHQFQFAGYYAALENGYYAKHGLYVKLAEPSGDNEAVSAVINRQANYGIAASDLLIKFQMGFPIVVLANIFQHSPYVFLTLKNNGSDNIHDISGKQVMLEEHADELIAYLKSERIALNHINFVPHSFTPKDLINGEVFAMSAYSTDEPFLLKEAGIDYNIYNPRSSGIDFFGDVLFTSQQEIYEHPERVKAFRQASIEGWEYAMENQEEIIQLIYNKYSKRHSIEHLKFEAEQTERLIMPEVVEIGYVNEKRWRRIGEIYHELGMLPSDLSLNGFVYDQNPEPGFWMKYRTSIIIILITIIIAFIALRFYRMSQKLKKSNALIKRREKQLIKFEKQYRDLSDYSPLPILITSLEEGNVLYINQMACDKFQISKPMALQKQISHLYAHPSDREKYIEKLTNKGFVKDEELLMKDTSGNKFNALITANIINFSGKNAIFAIMLDISQRVFLEEQLKISNEYKDKLFSIIAHDLRGPIGTIDNLLETMIDINPEESSKRIDIFQKLQLTTKRTYQLLDNLLKWALSQKDEISFNPQINNLSDIIKFNKNLFETDANNKGIKLNNHCEPNLNAYYDEDMIDSVLRNLISNALKFTSEGGEVSIHSSTSNNQVKIWVKDTGRGIEKEQLLLFLEEGNKEIGMKSETGTGLGLVLCKEFIKKNKGEIWVESEIGVGSTFYFTLPLK
jgi:PAS domain S-box-containing protein